MYIASKKSRKKIFHTEQCSHVKNIAPQNRLYFYTLQDAQAAGYRSCRTCSAVMWYYRRESAELLSFCFENGLTLHFDRKKAALSVKTPHSLWKIIVNGQENQLFLYHRNMFDKEDPKSPFPLYHSQKFRSPTILGYLEYIVQHDHYRQYNPLEIYHKKLRWDEHHYRKGSKHYKKQQKRFKRQRKRQAIHQVEALLKSLGDSHKK
jgi:hypothetical protein